MNLAQTTLLGAIAGLTIYFGLPLGRIPYVSDRVRAFLTMTSAGVLVFLLFDIFANAKEQIEDTLTAALAGAAPVSAALGLILIFVAGLAAGLLGLVAFESRFLRAHGGTGVPLSPVRLAMVIAAGLGLHNFSEGLAIGQSSGQGKHRAGGAADRRIWAA